MRQKLIDDLASAAAWKLKEQFYRIKRFTAGQYPYRLAKTLLCSVSDRIEQQWAAEATLSEIKALKRIRKSRYC